MKKRIGPSKIMKGMKFYVVEDLSSILGLTNLGVRDYLRKGKIKAVKVGLRWYVSEKNLSDFLLCKGIRDLPDDQLISMINRAVEIKFKEWSDEAIPKMQKVVADYLLKKEKERDKKNIAKILPESEKVKEHIRYKKEFAKVK